MTKLTNSMRSTHSWQAFDPKLTFLAVVSAKQSDINQRHKKKKKKQQKMNKKNKKNKKHKSR